MNVDNNFTSIIEKCPFIECLAHKDCYLDKTLFKCLESNVKHLKCISIFQCILDIKAIDLNKDLKTLSQRLSHLSIYQIKRYVMEFHSVIQKCEKTQYCCRKLFRNQKVILRNDSSIRRT